MKKFLKLNKVSTLINKEKNKKINVLKFQKEWTKRFFFSLENEKWERLIRTMFARKYDAERRWFNILNKINK